MEGFRQGLNAQSDKHQGIAAKIGKSLLDSELGEINDVIGGKCLCVLQKFFIHFGKRVKYIHILQ